MNTKARVFVAILCLLVVGGLVYVLIQGKASTPSTDTTTTKSQQESPQPSASTSPAPKGVYTDYSPDQVAVAGGTKLLFFHAPWCPQCRALDSDIKAATLPDNLKVFKVDYDTNQALRTKYGVTIQTTIVKINDAGGKIKSYVAYDQPTFASVEQALLK